VSLFSFEPASTDEVHVIRQSRRAVEEFYTESRICQTVRCPEIHSRP